jgi:hypothetical protein
MLTTRGSVLSDLIDFFRNLHSSDNLYVVPVLESSCILCTFRFCAPYTPSNYLEVFGFERSLIEAVTSLVCMYKERVASDEVYTLEKAHIISINAEFRKKPI